MNITAASTPETPPTPTPDQIVVKCVGLTKVFKDFWLRSRVRAVDGIDLDIYRGEVFGLLGPNGSGKSTTIKMLLGLLHATDGKIAIFGHHPRDVKIKEKIGYLPEESYLYRFLSARETLNYYGRLFHQDRRKRHQRTDQLLEYVGLDRVADRPVGEFSKGMQRRIGLAQALINDPQLLILDEPTTGMDPIGTRQIKDLLLDLRQRGKTILLCSHLLADVEDVTDRVAIMFGGKVRKAGTIDGLLTQDGLTTIESEHLDPQTLNEIEQVLERRGKHIARVDHPRQKLEQLFLDIVHEAQREGAATSGATSGGRMAAFLAGGAAADGEQAPEEVIDDLLKPIDVEAQHAPSPEPTPPTRDDSAEQVLDDLIQSKPAPPKGGAASDAAAPQTATQSSTPTEAPPPPPRDEPDEDVLSGLMGGPKSD